jgi:hypothetical protein
VRALVDIARLEAGQPTAATLVAHVDARSAVDHARSLQTAAREALTSLASTSPVTEAARETTADGSRAVADGDDV